MSLFMNISIKSFTACLLLLIVVLTYTTSAQRLGKILDQVGQQKINFSSLDYDELHGAILSDQIDNYHKPIKSLNTRNVKLLNGLYEFCLDPQTEGFDAKWFEKSLVGACPKANYYKMPIPSAFNDIPTEERVKNYMGWMWYQTEVLSSNVEFGTTWFLQFENINYMCMIWVQVSGQSEATLVGSHVGGHLPIVVNISSSLGSIYSLERKEVLKFRLTVAVNNMLTENTIPSGRMVNLTSVVGKPYFKFEPDFDFFHFAGIMGDVQLIQLPPAYVNSVSFVQSTEHDDDDELLVCITRPLGARVGSAKKLSSLGSSSENYIRFSVTQDGPLAEDNNERQTECCVKVRMANFIKNERLNIRVSYETANQLGDGDVDIFEIKLAGGPVSLDSIRNKSSSCGQLQGFGTHHEQVFSGHTMSLPAIMKDLYLMRQMGVNVLRTSHYPYSRAYLDACDELGIAVIAECPAVGLRSFGDAKLRLHKQIMLEMMERDHDHRAIVMWSVANEPESQLEGAREYFTELLEFVRKQPTRGARPLTAAIAQSHTVDTIGDLLDVVMINRYFGWYESPAVLESIRPGLVASLVDGWAKKLGAQKPLLISEFGADTVAGLHSATGTELFSEEYQRALVVEHEKVFDELAASSVKLNFLGAMLWNFADFSTHESLGRVGGNRKGVFTRDRRPKLAAGAIKEIFTKRCGV